MYSANGATPPPPLDPQALQSTPISFSRHMTPPGAPRLPRSDDDPPLLMDEDPPAQMHTAISFFDLSHQVQLAQDRGPPQLQLPPQQQQQQFYSQPQIQDQFQGSTYQPVQQFYSQSDQQMMYASAAQGTFFQTTAPSSFYQQPPPLPVQYTDTYQPSYNPPYPQSFGFSHNNTYNLSIERQEVLAIPPWDRPAEQGQVLSSYQLAPLNSNEFHLHIISQIEEIRQHNRLECTIDDIQAQIYKFPSINLSLSDPSDQDDIDPDTDQQASTLTRSSSYYIQENQMKLEAQMAKMQQDREDQEKMIDERRRIREEQREQRRITRRAGRRERKQKQLEYMHQKHEKNLKNFALRFNNPASALSPLSRVQSNTENTHECTIVIDKSTRVYNPDAWSEESHRFRNMVVGNGYGRLFWPGYIDLEKERGTSTVKIGLFGLELDGFLGNKDMFIATQTEIPGSQEQNAYIKEIEQAITNVPGMKLCGCDPSNGMFYTFKSQRSN